MKNHETLNDTFDITPTEVVAKPIKRNRETVALTNVSEMKDKDVAYDGDETQRELLSKPEVNSNGKLSKRQRDALALTDIGEMKEKDVAYVRANIYKMTEMLQEAAQESLETAMESSHPRAYEVCGNLMSQCADVAEKLVRLQGTNQRLNEDRVSVNATQNNTTVTNNVMFSGSTAELFAEMKKLNQADKQTK